MEEKNNNNGESGVPADSVETQDTTTDHDVATSEPTASDETSQSEQSSSREESSSMRNLIIGIVVAVLVIAGVVWYIQSGRDGEPLIDPGTATSLISAETEVARVNGETLYGSDLTLQMAQAAQVAGVANMNDADPQTIALLQSQSLDAIVNTELIIQAAQADGLSVAQEEVDAEFDTLATNIGGEEAAETRLASLGFTIDAFKENLVGDLLIRKYLEMTITDADAFEVSEEEIQAFYNQVTGGQVEGMPTLEEAREQITGQLLGQKQQAALIEIVEGLRKVANIEILI